MWPQIFSFLGDESGKPPIFLRIPPPLNFSGVGHSGGSTSTPSDARGTLDHSGDSGAGAVGQDVDSASEENSVPRGVLGKRRGEQLASGDRFEKKGVVRIGRWCYNVAKLIKAYLF